MNTHKFHGIGLPPDTRKGHKGEARTQGQQQQQTPNEKQQTSGYVCFFFFGETHKHKNTQAQRNFIIE